MTALQAKFMETQGYEIAPWGDGTWLAMKPMASGNFLVIIHTTECVYVDRASWEAGGEAIEYHEGFAPPSRDRVLAEFGRVDF